MIAVLKLSPVFVLAALMISGFDALIAAPLATIVAALIAMWTEKKNFAYILDAAITNVREITIALFILMAAYALAETFMSTGVGASIINMALNLGITGKTVALTGAIVTSVLSIATGTSWGTFAACAPIFLWLNHIVGGNILLTTAAIAGGACFGDNIGLISDTTIVSSGIQGVEVVRRIRHQGVWSGLVLLCGVIAFGVAGIVMKLPSITGNGTEAINQIPAEACRKIYTTMNTRINASIKVLTTSWIEANRKSLALCAIFIFKPEGSVSDALLSTCSKSLIVCVALVPAIWYTIQDTALWPFTVLLKL